MNITAVRAMLSSQDTVRKLRQAIYHTNKLKWSVAHVSNRNNKTFLGVRVRDGKLIISDRNNNDITQLIVSVLRGIK